MGLDITAYRKLKPVAKPQFNEDGGLANQETEWLPGAGMEWYGEDWLESYNDWYKAFTMAADGGAVEFH